MILKNFIVFEGIDGAGTSTQIKRLAEHFDNDKIFVTAEPTTAERTFQNLFCGWP